MYFFVFRIAQLKALLDSSTTDSDTDFDSSHRKCKRRKRGSKNHKHNKKSSVDNNKNEKDSIAENDKHKET